MLLPRMVLPPGEHNKVPVYTLPPNGKKSWVIQNPQMNPDHDQKSMSNLSKHFIEICS